MIHIELEFDSTIIRSISKNLFQKAQENLHLDRLPTCQTRDKTHIGRIKQYLREKEVMAINMKRQFNSKSHG